MLFSSTADHCSILFLIPNAEYSLWHIFPVIRVLIVLSYTFVNNTGVDRPSADVLRRTDVGTGLVHGAKRGQRTQINGVQGENDYLYHTSTVVWSLFHVRQDTVAGQRPDGVPGHAQRSYWIFQNVTFDFRRFKIVFINTTGEKKMREHITASSEPDRLNSKANTVKLCWDVVCAEGVN